MLKALLWAHQSPTLTRFPKENKMQRSTFCSVWGLYQFISQWVSLCEINRYLMSLYKGQRCYLSHHGGVLNTETLCPQDLPWLQWPARTHKTWQIVALMPMIDYHEKTESKIGKGKRHKGKIQRKQGSSFQGSLPMESPLDVLNPPSNALWQCMWKVIYQGCLLETQHPGGLLEWSQRHPLPSTSQNLRLTQKESKSSA